MSPERFRCLALADGQSGRAICPLEARVERVLGPSIPVWGVPLHPHMMVSDVICPEDDARRQLLPALLDYLRHRPEGRALLVLGPLPADSVLWEGLRRLPGGRSCTHATRPADVFDCGQPFEELMSRLTKNFRGKLRRNSRRLSALDDVRFVNVTEAADLPRELEAFLQVEASGWKGESGTGSAIQLHPELVAFYRTLTSTLGGTVGRIAAKSTPCMQTTVASPRRSAYAPAASTLCRSSPTMRSTLGSRQGCCSSSRRLNDAARITRLGD